MAQGCRNRYAVARCHPTRSPGNTGADSGYDFIRCWDDSDPNDKEFRRSIAGPGIEIIPSDMEGWTSPEVTLYNFEVWNPFLAGINAKGCILDVRNVYVRGAQVGYGFELDGSSGKLAGCTAEGCGFDGFHADGTLSVGDRVAQLTLEGCWALGIAYLPQGFGDGFSAHTWPRHW